MSQLRGCHDFEVEGASRCLDLAPIQHGAGIAGIDQDSHVGPEVAFSRANAASIFPPQFDVYFYRESCQRDVPKSCHFNGSRMPAAGKVQF